MNIKETGMSTFKVSAIVSTYASERFMRGLLEDLTRQTIGTELEIIVIDSGSPENERAIVEEYQQRFPNIVYERTERETVYGAWNRGIRKARAPYVTNANTDDRHRVDAYEVLASALDKHPEVGLVYPDVLITEQENETFECNSSTRIYRFEEPSFKVFEEGACNIGPMPMWRKELHSEVGYFDADMVTSGDYDMWYRMLYHTTFMHIRESLGLYLEHPESVEHRNELKKYIENRVIVERNHPVKRSFLNRKSKQHIIDRIEKINALSEKKSAEDLDMIIEECDKQLDEHENDYDFLYLKATALLRKGNRTISDQLYQKVLALEPNHSLTLNNLSVVKVWQKKFDEAIALQRRAVALDKRNVHAHMNLIELLIKQGKRDDARSELLKLLRIFPYHREALDLAIQQFERKNPVLNQYFADLRTFLG